MLQWLLGRLGYEPRRKSEYASEGARWREMALAIRAKYDAAQTTPENRRHWINADSLSAKSANSLAVRKNLRERARYEIANNCWAEGMVSRWANYLIGTGPRLQIRTESRQDNSNFERVWNDWAAEIGLVEELQTWARAKLGDGEAFGLVRTNPQLSHPVKVAIQGIECDQVTTPDVKTPTRRWVDGIELDGFGNPQVYHILDDHPGDMVGTTATYSRLDARYVYHWFRRKRPGQVRGVPEISPGLELFGQLRRYSTATLSAAEIAALFALTIETEMPPGDQYPLLPFDQASLERGMITALPEGWKQRQLQPTQPITGYDIYERCLLRQLASALNIPFGVAIGDFSGYNYSSGRLDLQGFSVTLKVERRHLVMRILERLFAEWYGEARLIPGLLPASFPPTIHLLPHVWQWDGMPHVDPVKEAQAKKIKLDANMTTLSEIYAEEGRDWEPNVRQRATEVGLCNELGILVATPGADLPTGPKRGADGATDQDAEDSEELGGD